MKYRKKPIVVEAIRWTGKNRAEIRIFCTHGAFFTPTRQDTEGRTTAWDLLIDSREGIMRAETGDYIIKGVKGEYYPCKANIFEETYERVAE